MLLTSRNRAALINVLNNVIPVQVSDTTMLKRITTAGYITYKHFKELIIIYERQNSPFRGLGGYASNSPAIKFKLLMVIMASLSIAPLVSSP